MKSFAVHFATRIAVAVMISLANLSAEVPSLRDSQSEFLQRISELQLGLDEYSSTDIASLAHNCFDAASVRHYQLQNASNLSSELCAVEMFLLVMTEDSHWKALPVLEILPRQKVWLSKLDNTPDGFLSYEEIHREFVYIHNIAVSSTDWGILDPAWIEACRLMIEKCELLERVAGTFYLPSSTGSLSQSYLNWIALAKPQLEAFQNQLEDYPLTDSAAAAEFLKHYAQLHSYLRDSDPLRVIPPTISSPERDWDYIQYYMVLSMDQLLIPPLILDWTQMLDDVASENWESALIRLDAIDDVQPKGRVSSPKAATNRQSSMQLLKWQIPYVFWTLLALSAIGIALTINAPGKGFLMTLGTLYPLAYIKMIVPPLVIPIVPETLFVACGTAILLLPAIAVGMVGKRRSIVSVLTVSWILCLLLPQTTNLTTAPPIPNRLAIASDITHYAAVLLIGILLIRVISQLLQTPVRKLKPRDLDRVVYPTLWFALLMMITAQMLRWIGVAESGFFVSQRLPEISLVIIISFQIIRFFILRWTNQLSPAKLLLLISTITSLGSITIATKALQLSYSQSSIAFLFWLSLLMLLWSYSVDLQSKFFALGSVSKKPTHRHDSEQK